MSKDIIVIGGGGHGKVVLEAVSKSGNFTIKGILDPAIPKGEKVLGFDVLGGDEILERMYKSGIRNAAVGIGTIGRYEIKRRVCARLKEYGFKMPVIAHPSAIIAADAVIGEGAFIAAGVVINPGVIIGEQVIINTRAVIEHDSQIGDFSHVSPGAVICGDVNIGEQVHIGAGALIIQGLDIADGSFVRAGQRVLKDVANAKKQ